jgi:hypothetical protein
MQLTAYAARDWRANFFSVGAVHQQPLASIAGALRFPCPIGKDILRPRHTLDYRKRQQRHSHHFHIELADHLATPFSHHSLNFVAVRRLVRSSAAR